MEEETRSVGIIGATGFIGRRVATCLEERAWTVIRFSRNPPAEDRWRRLGERPDLQGLDAVINLAGESIAQRWTRSVWERIRASRVDLTQAIVAAVARMPAAERPRVLLNASAVGYYAPGGDRELRESAVPGTGRLEELCRDWEAAAVEAEELGLRVVRLRTGIVLGREGEAWGRLRNLFGLGLGGRLGSGLQWMSWIHLEDEVAAIAFALENESLRGPLNLCAPEPVTNREFTRLLASALQRPALFPVPGFLLRLVMGEFGEELLASYRALPARLQAAGFEFRYATLARALDELLAERESQT